MPKYAWKLKRCIFWCDSACQVILCTLTHFWKQGAHSWRAWEFQNSNPSQKFYLFNFKKVIICESIIKKWCQVILCIMTHFWKQGAHNWRAWEFQNLNPSQKFYLFHFKNVIICESIIRKWCQVILCPMTHFRKQGAHSWRAWEFHDLNPS